MPKEWLRTLLTIMEDQYYVTAILRAFAIAGRTQSRQQTAQTPTKRGGLSTGTSSLFLIQMSEGPTNRRNSGTQPYFCHTLASRIRQARPWGAVAGQEHRPATQGRCGLPGSPDRDCRTESTRSGLSFHPLVDGSAYRTSASQAPCGYQLFDRVQEPQTPGVSLRPSQAGFEASPGPEGRPASQETEEGRYKKTKASAGRCAFAYCDEAEFHLNPGLSRCWSARGRRVIVPSAGVNRKVPVFGALDAMTGELTALVTEKKRSSEFLDFLHWLVEDIYGTRAPNLKDMKAFVKHVEKIAEKSNTHN
jgi:hypothetical protein